MVPQLLRSAAMRAVSLLVIAGLLCSGCAALVIAPVGGAATGAAIAAVRSSNDSDISYVNHMLVGTLAGVIVDAVMIVVFINALHREDFEIRQVPPLPAR